MARGTPQKRGTMKRARIRQVSIAAGIACIPVLGIAPSTALASTNSRLMDLHPIKVTSDRSRLRQGPGDNTPCHPVAVGDYVHVSSGDASGHGWWEPGTCAGGTAYVCVQLQEDLGGSWQWKGSGTCAYLPTPGGGSGKRVTTRVTCASTEKTSWRSNVSVNYEGEELGIDSIYTPAQSLACRT